MSRKETADLIGRVQKNPVQMPPANQQAEVAGSDMTLQERIEAGLEPTPVNELLTRDANEPTDLVNHPPHYKQGGIECIDAIQAALTPEEFRGYCKGNAIKYEWRERHKGGMEDLKKAAWYLNRLAEGE